MAGGIVFNAPDPQFRASAHMASFTNDGSFFQWGFFAEDSNFVFQGGIPVPDASLGDDGQWHELQVVVTDTTYSLYLDGEVMATDVQLEQLDGGYFGLFVSTSQVAFRAVQLEGELR